MTVAIVVYKGLIPVVGRILTTLSDAYEDIKIYTDRMNLDYWNNYVDQFNRIKHDVIKYLELEAEASWVQSKSIVAMKNEQLKKFNDVEESMLKLQSQFNYRTVQYIKINEDGILKKYICMDKS